jgi:hypothetical protein
MQARTFWDDRRTIQSGITVRPGNSVTLTGLRSILSIIPLVIIDRIGLYSIES